MAYAFKRTEEALQQGLNRGAPQSTPTTSSVQGGGAKEVGSQPRSSASAILERNQGGQGQAAVKNRVQGVMDSELAGSQARDEDAIRSAKIDPSLSQDIDWGTASQSDEGMGAATKTWDAALSAQAPTISHRSTGLQKTQELGQNLGAALGQGKKRYTPGMGALDVASLGGEARGIQADASKRAADYQNYFEAQRKATEERLGAQTEGEKQAWKQRNSDALEKARGTVLSQADALAAAENERQQQQIAQAEGWKKQAQTQLDDYSKWRDAAIERGVADFGAEVDLTTPDQQISQSSSSDLMVQTAIKAQKEEAAKREQKKAAQKAAARAGLSHLGKYSLPDMNSPDLQFNPYKSSDFYGQIEPQYSRLATALARDKPGYVAPALQDTLDEALAKAADEQRVKKLYEKALSTRSGIAGAQNQFEEGRAGVYSSAREAGLSEEEKAALINDHLQNPYTPPEEAKGTGSTWSKLKAALGGLI